MDKILAAWKLQTIQDYLNIREHLAQYNKTDEDVHEYVKQQKFKTQHNAVMKPILESISCPSCKQPMKLYPVNSCKGDQIENKNKHSQWYCPFCDTSIFNTETMQEVIYRQAAFGKMVKDPMKGK